MLRAVLPLVLALPAACAAGTPPDPQPVTAPSQAPSAEPDDGMAFVALRHPLPAPGTATPAPGTWPRGFEIDRAAVDEAGVRAWRTAGHLPPAWRASGPAAAVPLAEAIALCAARGARLPTEREWNWAAGLDDIVRADRTGPLATIPAGSPPDEWLVRDGAAPMEPEGVRPFRCARSPRD